MAAVDGAGMLLSMAKVRSRGRAQTARVWKKIHLRQWREMQGLSVEALAAKSGVSPGLISQIENRKCGGSAESLEKIAAALRITVGEMLDVEPRKGQTFVRMWVDDADSTRLSELSSLLSRLKAP